VLGPAGSRVTPDVLASEVYTPGLKGSLQPDLLGAIRRRGLLAYELPPTLEALSAELAAGHPILVLQNLGPVSRPVWHYAVVIGADASTETITLRSGREARLQMPTRKFMRSWDKADRWAVVVLRPDEVPVDPRRERLHRAVLGLEAAGRPVAASQAWSAVINIWPDDSVALFGLGNARYSLGDPVGARAAWTRYVKLNPGDPSGINNLAVVLGDLGCRNLALQLARETLAHTRRFSTPCPLWSPSRRGATPVTASRSAQPIRINLVDPDECSKIDASAFPKPAECGDRCAVI
jgi:hypothetical protein